MLTEDSSLIFLRRKKTHGVMCLLWSHKSATRRLITTQYRFGRRKARFTVSYHSSFESQYQTKTKIKVIRGQKYSETSNIPAKLLLFANSISTMPQLLHSPKTVCALHFRVVCALALRWAEGEKALVWLFLGHRGGLKTSVYIYHVTLFFCCASISCIQ